MIHLDPNSLHLVSNLFHLTPHSLSDALSNSAQQHLELLRHSGLHREALQTAMGLDGPVKAIKSTIGQAYTAIKPVVANRFPERVQQIAGWPIYSPKLKVVIFPHWRVKCLQLQLRARSRVS
jgi:hypothetical protein